jgi:S-disulfanyl-L-cysteine oxidoreductase SoxD
MRFDRVVGALTLVTGLVLMPAQANEPHYRLGQTATAAEIAPWNIDVQADGQGLPADSGSVAQGLAVYAEHCATCHGDKGQGGLAPRLVGGFGTLAAADPVRTVGSYWPYATTLFDYIRRAMPFDAPESLRDDEVYAVSAYVLWLNGVVPQHLVLNADNLPKIVMPNRNGFVSPDPRPDVP